MTRVLVNVPTFPTHAPRGALLLATAALAAWGQVARLFALKR